MKREQWWPVGLAAALGVTVLANIVLVMAATGGDGAAVQPDYYRRAVAWDSTQAVAARSRRLGWTMTARLDPPVAAGQSAVTVTLADQSGAPVVGARVRLEGYALARSRETTTGVTLGEVDGRYAARLTVLRTEWYEFRLTAIRGDARFVATIRCMPGLACRER